MSMFISAKLNFSYSEFKEWTFYCGLYIRFLLCVWVCMRCRVVIWAHRICEKKTLFVKREGWHLECRLNRSSSCFAVFCHWLCILQWCYKAVCILHSTNLLGKVWIQLFSPNCRWIKSRLGPLILVVWSRYNMQTLVMWELGLK